MDFSVIIVSYQAPCFLEQCLHSVERASRGLEVEVRVVDNYSTDNTRDYIGSKFPGITFIWLDANLGFSKANNLAWQNATGDLILFLNPDVIIPEDFFSRVKEWFAMHPQTGAAGVRMIDGSGRFLKESKRGLPTPWRSCCKLTGLTALFPHSRILAGYYAGHLDENHPAEVDVLAGACMALSRKAAEITGGFDETFFMYAEDIDLSVRVKQAGFSVTYLADPVIIHFKGESTRKLTFWYIRHFYGSMSLFVNKHYAARPLLKAGMRIFIRLAQLAATVLMGIQKISGAIAGLFISRKRTLQTLVVAGQQGFNEVIQLARYSDIPLRIAGRVCIETNDQSYALGHADSLEEIIAAQQAEAVIFCLGDIDAGAAIKIMQKMAGRCRFYFHYRGSESMVSSHNRSSRGNQVSPLFHKPANQSAGT